MKKIKVAITDSGKIAMDLEGFTGSLCDEEAKRLRALLLEMGIETDQETFRRKTPKIPDRGSQGSLEKEGGR